MSLFVELKRRNVFRVGIVYAVVAWLIVQVADVMIDNIGAPDWLFGTILLLLGIGFPVVVVFAWAFELTPEGIKREKDVDRSQSITGETGRRLDRSIIVVLVLALAYFAVDKFGGSPPAEPDPQPAAETADERPPAEAPPSIAVLPFTDMSPEGDQGYFSDGISEELLNLLVRVEGLKVASRTSSFAFKGSKRSLAEIARELQVDHVLEGSVRKADNRVRITAQLIDADTDRHLWSDAYDRELVDIFAIQDEIANAIVGALRTELGVLAGEAGIRVTAATENLDAYELYLRARQLFIARENMEESIRLFEQAVGLDPNFARAWEGLGAVYAVVESWGIRDRDYTAMAETASRRALELNADLSMPWAVLGSTAIGARSDFLAGMEQLERAVRHDSLNTTAYLWRGIALISLGYFERGIADTRRCLEIDPRYHNCRRHMGIGYLATGDMDEALRIFQLGAEDGFYGAELLYAPTLVRRGNRLAAALNFRRWESDRNFPASAFLDAIEHPEQDHSERLARYLEWLETADSKTYDYDMEMALLGAYDRVLTAGFSNAWVWVPGSEGFRESDYFKALMRSSGAYAYWLAHGFPDHCRATGPDDFECAP